MKIEKITPQIAGMLIGQKAELFWDGQLDRTGTLIEIQQENEGSNGLGFDTEEHGLLWYPYKDVVFLLRRLDNITEDEARELYFASNGITWETSYGALGYRYDCLNNFWLEQEEFYRAGYERIIGNPAAWLYLLGKGFDLFGLIDSGLAKEIKP